MSNSFFNCILSISELEVKAEQICRISPPPYSAISQFFISIHAENVKAGWWTDLTTGQRLKSRNFGELSALIWSEIGEALIASGPDDKLPQYDGEMVEIADALIRQADLFGSEQLGPLQAGVELVQQQLSYRGPAGQSVRSPNCIENWLNFFESGRKGKADTLFQHAKLFAYLIRAGQVREQTQLILRPQPGITVAPLWTVLAAKVAFNRERADHKIENRLLDGGKKL